MAENQVQSPLVEWLAEKFHLGSRATHKEIDAAARTAHLNNLRTKYGLASDVSDAMVEKIAAEKAFQAAKSVTERQEKYNKEHPDDPPL